jgi:phosphatidylinositol-3-phosphatase
MLHIPSCGALGALLLIGTLAGWAKAAEIKTVFVIAMENHNWIQPDNKFAGRLQQIYLNRAAPFINSLVDGSAHAVINGKEVGISGQVSYATAYHNVLARSDGDNPHIHPSEPNYMWAEAGTNFGVHNDHDPYAETGGTNQSTTEHLSSYLTAVGKNWKSYQEDIDLIQDETGQRTNTPLPKDLWTVPLTSFSGFFATGTNAFNGSAQYNYAAKHNPMVFFADANGGNDATANNPLRAHYAPLQQLMTDLANNTVADYNWITPNQYNDMHSELRGGYKGLKGDSANIKQGDDFLSQLIPIIMASKSYKNDGAIIIWWDEAESDGQFGDNADDFNHTLCEIVISPLAHRNVKGIPYASPMNLTHSSDLRTMQEIFGAGPLLGDAANADDLSDLFEPDVVPSRLRNPRSR